MALADSRRRFAGRTAREVLQLERLRRRDSQAWSGLFETEYQFVCRAALTQVRDHTVARLVAGQVFLDALEQIQRLRDDGRPLRAWLLGLARQRSAEALDKRDVSTSFGEGASPAEAAAFAVLAQLAPQQREVLFLRTIEGSSMQEVAELTGLREGAIETLLYQALRASTQHAVSQGERRFEAGSPEAEVSRALAPIAGPVPPDEEAHDALIAAVVGGPPPGPGRRVLLNAFAGVVAVAGLVLLSAGSLAVAREAGPGVMAAPLGAVTGLFNSDAGPPGGAHPALALSDEQDDGPDIGRATCFVGARHAEAVLAAMPPAGTLDRNQRADRQSALAVVEACGEYAIARAMPFAAGDGVDAPPADRASASATCPDRLEAMGQAVAWMVRTGFLDSASAAALQRLLGELAGCEPAPAPAVADRVQPAPTAFAEEPPQPVAPTAAPTTAPTIAPAPPVSQAAADEDDDDDDDEREDDDRGRRRGQSDDRERGRRQR